MGDQSETARTLTALYETDAAARRTVDRLVETGIPRDRIRAERASEAEVDAKKTGRSKLMAALFEFEMPEPDRQSYERGLDRGGTLIVVSDVPGPAVDRALDIMEAEALDTEAEAEGDDPDQAGARGTMGGYGVGMGDVDRLTGRRLGDADPPGDDPRQHADTNYGSAQGGEDRLTGRPTGGRRARAY